MVGLLGALTPEEQYGEGLLAPMQRGHGLGLLGGIRQLMGPSVMSRMQQADAAQQARLASGERSPTPLTEENMWLADDVAGGLLGPMALALGTGSGMAESIAKLLREGRAAEVTDEMLGALGPNDQRRLFELYESGATGMDLPMDEASRMARAEGMGLDPSERWYTGTNADIAAFEARRAPRNEQMNSAGIHLAESPEFAARYADGDGASVYPLVAGGQRTDGNVLVVQGTPEAEIVADLYKGSRQKPYWSSMDGTAGGPKATAPLGVLLDNFAPARAEQVLNKSGVDSLTYTAKYGELAPGGRGMMVSDQSPALFVRDPRNIRSRFARFDPRLKHNADLLASLAGAGLLGSLAYQPDEAP